MQPLTQILSLLFCFMTNSACWCCRAALVYSAAFYCIQEQEQEGLDAKNYLVAPLTRISQVSNDKKSVICLLLLAKSS